MNIHNQIPTTCSNGLVYGQLIQPVVQQPDPIMPSLNALSQQVHQLRKDLTAIQNLQAQTICMVRQLSDQNEAIIRNFNRPYATNGLNEQAIKIVRRSDESVNQ